MTNAPWTKSSGVIAALALLGLKISKDVSNEVSCDRAMNAYDIPHTTGSAVGLYFHLITACDPNVAAGCEVCC